MERCAESTEKTRHRDIGFAIAKIDRRIEQHRFAVAISAPIAAPQVAVKQRRHGMIVVEEDVQPLAQLLTSIYHVTGGAVLFRHLQLRQQTLLTEEFAPLRARTIGLRRRADRVVTIPAELIARHSVL